MNYEQLLNHLMNNSSGTLKGQLSGNEYQNLINRMDNLSITYDPITDTTTITQTGHLKLFLNISTDFHPGMESIGQYLLRQSEELKRLGEHMIQQDSDNLEDEIKNWRQQEKIDWNTEGTY